MVGDVLETLRKIIEDVKQIQDAKELVEFYGYSVFRYMYVWGPEHESLGAPRSRCSSKCVLSS